MRRHHMQSVRRNALALAWLFIGVQPGGLLAQERLVPAEELERRLIIEEVGKQPQPRGKDPRIQAQIERIQKGPVADQSRSIRDGGINPRIVNGVMTAGFPTVGAVLYRHLGNDGVRRFTTWCTGTLVGSRTFVTAAHCVEEDGTAGNYRVFLQHAGHFNVRAIAYQKDLYRFPKADIAILHLESKVPGVRVQPLTDQDVRRPGLPGTIVGFGRTGGQNEVYGIKRTGFVKIGECKCPKPTAVTCAPEGELVCWTYDALIANPGMDSNTCNADSGGPLLFERFEGQMQHLIGVTSGGTRRDCLSRDEAYDAAVFKYLAWVKKEAGADLGVSSAGKAVGDKGVAVLAAAAKLDNATPRQTYAFAVPPGTSRLVVSMNGDDIVSGNNQFDLQVQPPASAANPAKPACHVRDALQFKSCTVTKPAAGEWSATVSAARGAGQFQLVTVTFAE